MHRELSCRYLGLADLGCRGNRGQAEVKLPSIISDNMVLQAGAAVPIWGWAEPGEEITVRLADRDRPGHGRRRRPTGKSTLKDLKPGDAMEMTIEDAAGEKKTIKNILVGEVWLCSGQSNMEMSVASATTPKKEIAAAKYPKIRFFS